LKLPRVLARLQKLPPTPRDSAQSRQSATGSVC
jgi:hypothetical protein